VETQTKFRATPKMIRILLLGRTGNNLFQYAIGRVLSRNGSWFNEASWREVSHFLSLPIQATVRRHPSIPSRALRKITGKHYWEYRGVPIMRETGNDQRFDSGFLEAPADCMLYGYFQSPRYFASMAGEIRAELLGLLDRHVATDPRVLATISEPMAVAVHVRRTDFLNLPAHQVCGPAYYHTAMETMRMRVPNARFYIFSDDPTWCQATFDEPDQVVVHDKRMALNPLHDLFLMSRATHHIIANSTYSWWAAWLADRAGQQVILPDRWFSSGICAPITEKMLPHWTSLPAPLK
jgi:hypothetical protein